MQRSIALPDVHSGYGFAIGNVAAFNMDDPEAVVSPGGVGFDINCGVRLLRTNLVRSHVVFIWMIHMMHCQASISQHVSAASKHMYSCYDLCFF